MFKKAMKLIAASWLLVAVVACNLQFKAPEASGSPGDGPGANEAGPSGTPTFTPTASATPLPSFTWTPERVMIGVSMDTNCRSGPGTVYDYLGGLAAGETTEALGRDVSGQFWVARNPDVPGGICWLWARYATVTGNWESLPVATQPPTPTPVEVAPSPLPAAYTGIVLNNGECFNLDNGQVTGLDGQCDILLAAPALFRQVNGGKLSGYNVSFNPPTRTQCINATFDPGDLAVQTDLYMCVHSNQGQVGFIVVRQYLGGIPSTGIVLDYWLFR